MHAILIRMSWKKWLAGADVHNQAVVDALLDNPQIEGSGVVVVSRWQYAADGWGRLPKLRIDNGPRTRQLAGTTFHPLAPGVHRIRFGRILRNTTAELEISVPVDGCARVEYQPAVWLWQRPIVAAVPTPDKARDV